MEKILRICLNMHNKTLPSGLERKSFNVSTYENIVG